MIYTNYFLKSLFNFSDKLKVFYDIFNLYFLPGF